MEANKLAEDLNSDSGSSVDARSQGAYSEFTAKQNDETQSVTNSERQINIAQLANDNYMGNKRRRF